TMSISPSLPGRFVRSFDMSWVTLASCAASVPEMRHASARISFLNVINGPFALSDAFNASFVSGGTLGGLIEPGFKAGLAESCVFARNQCSLANFRPRVKCLGVSDNFARVLERGQAPPDQVVQTEFFRPSYFDSAVDGLA